MAHDSNYHLPYSWFQVVINGVETETDALRTCECVCVCVCVVIINTWVVKSVKKEPFSDK